MNAREREQLLQTLKARFEANMPRHPNLDWAAIAARLDAHRKALESLHEMERTGGEPDVVSLGETGDSPVFCDCSAESPSGRRSLCFDREALESRKENKPEGSAAQVAAAMGAALLTEAQYRELQGLGEFDLKTSSWLATPDEMRKLGGALFGDRRFGRVFVYHNGAQSYYAARGFRAWLRI